MPVAQLWETRGASSAQRQPPPGSMDPGGCTPPSHGPSNRLPLGHQKLLLSTSENTKSFSWVDVTVARYPPSRFAARLAVSQEMPLATAMGSYQWVVPSGCAQG